MSGSGVEGIQFVVIGADALVTESVDLDAVMAVASSAPPLAFAPWSPPEGPVTGGRRGPA